MAPKKPKKKLSAYNRHVQREMKAGKSMKQAAASWNKKSGKPKAASKSKPKGGNRKVGKNGFNTQKIFKYMRIGALTLPAAQTILSNQQPATKINQLKKDYFGVDANGQFNLAYLAKGWMPFIASSLVTIGIPKLMSLIRRG